MGQEATEPFDLVVVGAGSGGMAAAKRARQLGARVALVERARTGGTCVLRGCIPKKWMVWGAQLRADQSLYPSFGMAQNRAANPATAAEWVALVHEREQLIDNLVRRHDTVLREASVVQVAGEAEFIDSHHLRVGQEVLHGRAFVLATGSSAQRGAWPGAHASLVSDDFFAAQTPPATAIIVGGGYIAVELTGILARLGVPCTLVCRSTLLRAFDTEVAHGMVRALTRHNVRVLEHTDVVEQTPLPQGGGSMLTVHHQGSELQLTAPWVLTALGRSPNTQALRLDRAGLSHTAGSPITVDAQQRTAVGHIFAVGDITDKPQLTPVAIRAGRRVAHLLFGAMGSGPAPMNLDHIPTAVFGPTPLAAVGLTQAQAEGRYGDDAAVRVSRFTSLKQARLAKDAQVPSIMKIVHRKSNGLVLGMHMLGEDAPEIMQGFAAALSAGVTLDALDATVALHPTQAEEFVLMGGP